MYNFNNILIKLEKFFNNLIHKNFQINLKSMDSNILKFLNINDYNYKKTQVST